MREAEETGDAMVVLLSLDITNDELHDEMRAMILGRIEGGYSHVVCLIDGFNDDPRELWEIVEVRAFCRRLVAQGFIAFLDMFTWLLPGTGDEPQNLGMGACEVWMLAEGKKCQFSEVNPQVLIEFVTAYDAAHVTAKQAIESPPF